MQIIKKYFLAMLVLFSTPSYLHAEPITIGILIGTGVVAIWQSYFGIKDIEELVNPSAQTQLNKLIAQERLEYARAKNAFEKCLSGTTSITERDARNLPIPCKELAFAFIKCGGKNELIDMIQNFDDAHE